MDRYKIINITGEKIYSDLTIHPGEIILDELKARKIKESEFAERLEMKQGDLFELLHGKRDVNNDISIRLGQLLNIDAQYWLRVQAEYDLFMLQGKHPLPKP